jgi:hypothetical protein
MLTGYQIFASDDITETIAAVLMREPDWSTLPAGTPANIRRLLERCLSKDPKLRLWDVGDARLALDERDHPEDELQFIAGPSAWSLVRNGHPTPPVLHNSMTNQRGKRYRLC